MKITKLLFLGILFVGYFSSPANAACGFNQKNYACCRKPVAFPGAPYTRVGGGCGYTRAGAVASCELIPGDGIKTEWRKSGCDHLNPSPPVSSNTKSISNNMLKKYLGVHENGEIVMWPSNTGTGERWQVMGNGCIYNPWLKKFLGVHENGTIVMWPNCSTGEKWQVKNNGCIFNPYISKYLGVHETGEIVMWPQCSTGEKWVIE